MKRPVVRLTVYLPAELVVQLKIAAARRRTSATFLVQESLLKNRYLALKTAPPMFRLKKKRKSKDAPKEVVNG